MGLDAVNGAHRDAGGVGGYGFAQVDEFPVGPHHAAPALEGAYHIRRGRRQVAQFGGFLLGIDMVQIRGEVDHTGVLEDAEAGAHQPHRALHHNFGFGAGGVFLVEVPVGDDVGDLVEGQAEGLAGVHARFVQAAVLDPDQAVQTGNGGELPGGRFGPARARGGGDAVRILLSPLEDANHCAPPVCPVLPCRSRKRRAGSGTGRLHSTSILPLCQYPR